jgi:ABC-2 type transport system ATP-binding protein
MTDGPLHLGCEAVSRVYGRRHVLREVSFRAAAGEVVAIVGRNGAGKSTLLSILAGRRLPDGGHVSVTVGERRATAGETRSWLGFLPHDLLVYPDLTARENLEFTGVLHGQPRPAERAVEVLAAVGLTLDADRTVRTFSRGMQQRTAIGRLMASGARAWLLDEPSTGLDESGRRWLLSLLAAQGREGRVILFTTHHPSEVETAATRVLVLDGGRLVADLPGGSEGAAAAFARVDGGRP